MNHLYIKDKRELPPNVHVGMYVSIGDDVYFHCNENHPCIQDRKLVSTYPFAELWGNKKYPGCGMKGGIYIGSDVWIGRGARVLDGVSNGSGAIVGAYSVVTKDVPAYSLVAGNPARVKKLRFTEQQIEGLLAIRWWEWERETIEERIEDFLDIEVFLKKYE